MGYDAVAVSADDLKAGISFVQGTLADNVPWVSANLTSTSQNSPVPTFISKKVGLLDIAITAITDFNNTKNNDGFAVAPYQEVLPELLKQLSKDHDVIIVLSTLSGTENRNLLSLFPGIDILLGSDRSLGKMAPVVAGKTLMTQTSSRGKYLGRLAIKWEGGDVWSNDRLPNLSQLQQRLAKLEKTITDLSQADSGVSPKKIARLELQQKRLTREIETRSTVESDQSGHNVNGHKLSFIPVQPKKSPKEIEAIVTSIEKKAKEK